MSFFTYFHEYLKAQAPIINQVKSKIKIFYLTLAFCPCSKECTYTRTALLPFPCQHEENVLTCTGVCVCMCALIDAFPGSSVIETPPHHKAVVPVMESQGHFMHHTCPLSSPR